MTGIAGIVKVDRAEPASTDLGAMAAALSPRCSGRVQRKAVGGAAFALCDPAPSTDPAHATLSELPDGRLLLFEGHLHNRAAILACLETSNSGNTPHGDSGVVAAAWNQWREATLERLRGEFALAVYDPGQGSLILARDILGVRPLFYACSTGGLAFASEIKVLLAGGIQAKPNLGGLSLFAQGAGLPPDSVETYFDGIYAVGPAQQLTFAQGKVSTRRYFDFALHPPQCEGSFQSVCDRFRMQMDMAVQRTLPQSGSVAIQISGGLDSSSIYGLAQRLAKGVDHSGPKVVAVTYQADDGSYADERRYIRALEQAYGSPIHRIGLSALGFSGDCEYQAYLREQPQLTPMWPTVDPVYRYAAEQGARVLLQGEGGDHLMFTPAYLLDMFRAFRWLKLWRHLRELPRWHQDAHPKTFERYMMRELVHRYLPPVTLELYRRMRRRTTPAETLAPYFTETLRGQVGRPGSHPAIDPVAPTAYQAALLQAVRTLSRVVPATHVAARYGLELRFPFIDVDLIQFVLNLPGTTQNPAGVPRGLLREALRDVLPEPVRQRRWKGDPTRQLLAGALRDVAWLENALRQGSAAAEGGYLDADRLRHSLPELKQRIEAGQVSACYAVGRVVGLEGWLRAFSPRP